MRIGSPFASKSSVTMTILAALLLLSQTAVAPPAGWRDRALSYADDEHMFGPLQQAAFSYSGSFVSFLFSEMTATISDYIVLAPGRNTPVFQTITSSIVAAGIHSVNGSIFEYASSAFRVRIRNNPTSALVIAPGAAAINATFMLSSGINARRYGQILNLSSLNFDARLVVTGSGTLSMVGSNVYANLQPGTMAIFRANAIDGESAVGADGQTSLMNATVQRRLALESFEVGVEGFVEASDAEYGHVTRLHSNLTAQGMEAWIEAALVDPVVIAFHLHDSVLAVDNDSEVIVRLDGVDVPQLPYLDDVVDYSNNMPACSYIAGPNGLLLLLYLPQSGGHSLTIEKVVPSIGPPDSNVIQIIAIASIIIVLLGIAAAVMVRRRSAN